MKTFDILKAIKTIPAYTLKRYPIESSLLMLCILVLTCLRVWSTLSPLPARGWNAANLKRIKIADPGDFSFAVFGDNRNSHTVFENLLKLIDHDPKIAFAVSLGDMIQGGGKKRYRYFIKQVKRYLGVPLITGLGKYETLGEGYLLYHDIFGSSYYSFQIGRNYFIVFDGITGKEHGHGEKSWLEEELQKSQLFDTRIVFMPVPLYDPRAESYHHPLPEGSSEILAELFLKYRVTRIFASHIHGYFEGQWKGIPYTITGGAGAELDGNDPDHYFFHYLRVHIKNSKVDVQAKQVPSSDYDRLNPFNYMAWLYINTFFRIHWIEIVLFLVAGGLVMAIGLQQLQEIRGRNHQGHHEELEGVS